MYIVIYIPRSRNDYLDFDMYSREKECAATSFSSKESGRSRGPGIDIKKVSDEM
jgi:hypothetical protein